MKYILVILIIVFGIGYWWWSENEQEKTISVDQNMQVNVAEDIEIVGKTETVQVYTNKDWGISFEYLKDWKIMSPTFGSTVSFFNLSVELEGENELPRPVIINITPKYWVDQIIERNGLDAFKETRIAGMDAIYYSSTDMSIPTWSYFILVNNKYWINISIKKAYEHQLQYVLDTLKITPVSIEGREPGVSL